MAVVYVGRNQDPSRVYRSLREAADRVGSAKPKRVTDGPGVAFVIDTATHNTWRNAAKSGPDAKKRAAKVKPDTASAPRQNKQKMTPVEEPKRAGGDG